MSLTKEAQALKTFSNQQDVEDFFSFKKIEIEQHLRSLVLIPNSPHYRLFEAALYSLTTPAKRLRPLITLAVVQTLGGNSKRALTAASALEMIHTYSLIHDDLPCMDDDDFRRGMPSLHKKYNEACALLTGDFLLTFAFDLLSQDAALSEKERLQLVQILARRAGAEGIIGGQLVDLESENRTIDQQRLDFMHYHKTASLFIAAVEFGAILAKASLLEASSLTAFGTHFGIAFQLLDDLLDSNSSDAKKGKATAVTLLGFEGTKKAAAEQLDNSLAQLSSLKKPTPLLTHLVLELKKLLIN